MSTKRKMEASDSAGGKGESDGFGETSSDSDDYDFVEVDYQVPAKEPRRNEAKEEEEEENKDQPDLGNETDEFVEEEEEEEEDEEVVEEEEVEEEEEEGNEDPEDEEEEEEEAADQGQDTIPRKVAAVSNDEDEDEDEDEDDDENDNGNAGDVPPAKKSKLEWSNNYSNTAMNIMKKMGFKSDKGLGKQNQGRLMPVEAFKQHGRFGLGLKTDKSAPLPPELRWDESIDCLEIPEYVSWFTWEPSDGDNDHDNADGNDYLDFENAIKFGPRITKIDDQNRFCDPEILTKMVQLKNIFDSCDRNLFAQARTRSNVFETIRCATFQNRAAVKMANMDALLDWMFTDPMDENGISLVAKDEPLYFADICAGPGGFSEYILSRRSFNGKGFGLTLRNSNDFELHRFKSGSPEFFDPFYGIQKDGNIYSEANQDSFAEYIFRHTPNGVHLVMADGGFSVENNENIQEILSKQLYLCQCLTALKILRPNGHFVCKFFDIYTTFSIGLVYLMSRCFKKIAIIKPNSSRPANSERYLVCKWKKTDDDDDDDITLSILKHLNQINKILNQLPKHEDNDVLELVDDEHLLKQHKYLEYMRQSNDRIGRMQIINLRKLATFYHNEKLNDKRQLDIRRQCLQLWKLADRLRKPSEHITIEAFLKELKVDWLKGILHDSAKQLNSKDDLKRYIESVYDWYFVPIGRKDNIVIGTTFFACSKRGRLHYYDGNMNCWPLVEQCHFDIPPGTIILGELVYEYSGEGLSQVHAYALHVIDAIALDGKLIDGAPLKVRRLNCLKFVIGVNKPFRTEPNPPNASGIVRMKPFYRFREMTLFFQQMRYYALKNNQRRYGITFNDITEKCFTPGGILLLNEINEHFFSLMSRSTGKLYYFHKLDQQSYYLHNMPPKLREFLFSKFRMSYQKRLTWIWTSLNQVELGNEHFDADILHRDEIDQFLDSKIPKEIDKNV